MLYLEAGRGDWIDELECSPILVGYDPVTGWPVYEGDTCSSPSLPRPSQSLAATRRAIL